MTAFRLPLLALALLAAPLAAKPAAQPDGTAMTDKPTEEVAAGNGASAEPSTEPEVGIVERLGSGFDELFDRGLPVWAWGVAGLVGLLLLRRLFRSPRRDDDLMGPPRPERYRNLPRY